MGNPVSTSIDLGSVALSDECFSDDLLTFTGAATYLAGTILARRRVATAVSASAVTGTGNGTCTAATVVGGDLVPKAGVYKLRCVIALTNGGTFRLEDPDGQVIAASLVLTVGAGAATVIKAGGMQFTITDGSTDFAVGDTFDLTVAAVNKLEAFATNGVGGVQRPRYLLTNDVTATGAGDIKVRALIRGVVKKQRLIIFADGNDSNVDVAVREELRSFGITPVDVQQTSS